MAESSESQARPSSGAGGSSAVAMVSSPQRPVAIPKRHFRRVRNGCKNCSEDFLVSAAIVLEGDRGTDLLARSSRVCDAANASGNDTQTGLRISGSEHSHYAIIPGRAAALFLIDLRVFTVILTAGVTEPLNEF